MPELQAALDLGQARRCESGAAKLRGTAYHGQSGIVPRGDGTRRGVRSSLVPECQLADGSCSLQAVTPRRAGNVRIGSQATSPAAAIRAPVVATVQRRRQRPQRYRVGADRRRRCRHRPGFARGAAGGGRAGLRRSGHRADSQVTQAAQDHSRAALPPVGRDERLQPGRGDPSRRAPRAAEARAVMTCPALPSRTPASWSARRRSGRCRRVSPARSGRAGIHSAAIRYATRTATNTYSRYRLTSPDCSGRTKSASHSTARITGRYR